MALIGSVETLKDLAIGIVITSVLFAITLQSPVLGFFCTIIIPLPTMFCRAKHGRTIGMVVPVIALLVLASLLGGISIDLLYFFELLFCGFILYELFLLRLSVEKTVVLTSAVTLAVGLFIVLVYSSTTAAGFVQLVSDYVRRNLEASLRLYVSMGVPADTIRPIEDALDGIQYVLVRIVPSLAVAAALFLSWASLLLARPMLKSYHLYYPDFGRLNLWKAPEPLVWSVIGCGLMLIIPEHTVKLFGINGLLILMTVYFFQGIAIISFYFEKKRFPRPLRFILYSLIALQQIVLLIVVGLGFFDMWLDFRKLGVEKN
ncbi:MAG: YybS family protein [Desulfobacterales bacterium]